MSRRVACRWCGERTYIESECRRCARARVRLDELLADLPWLAAFRLSQAAVVALRSMNAKAVAAEDPGWNVEAWRKRHAKQAEMSEYFTKVLENARK